MRTTLDIDDDVLATVKDLARSDGKTMGAVISELVRKALTTPSLTGLSEPHASFDHDDALFPRFPKRGGTPVTNELVRRVQDEIDIDDATPWDHERDRPRTFDEAARRPKR